MALDLSEFKNLDPNNIGSWPMLAKALVILVICIGVLGLGYWYDTQDQLAALEKSRHSEQELKQSFEVKQAKAVNLEAYREQMAEMEESFVTMLRQLPSKTEVADLLVDITQTGLGSGLEFDLFKPGNAVPQEFYAEMPIQITVNGNYHSFGEFASGVAALPRIVTLHNINVARSGKAGSKADALVMQVQAKTYRYLDDDELEAQRQSKAAERKPRRR